MYVGTTTTNRVRNSSVRCRCHRQGAINKIAAHNMMMRVLGRVLYPLTRDAAPSRYCDVGDSGELLFVKSDICMDDIL